MITMLKRTATGLFLVGVLLLCLWIGSLGKYGYIAFDAIMFLFITVATFEMYFVMKKKYRPMLVPVVVAVVAIYPLQFFFGYIGLFVALAIAVLAAMPDFIFNVIDLKFEDLTATLFVLLYPFAIGSLSYPTTAIYGVIPIMLATGAPLAADAFAYFGGSLIKGPKIFPQISPKKTYAGSICGLFGGVAGGLLVYWLFEVVSFPTHIVFTFTNYFNGNSGLAIMMYCILGFLCGLVGEIGDLTASSIKRRFEIKDYSNLLGTHGGMMDRIDSILFAMLIVLPIMLLFFPV